MASPDSSRKSAQGSGDSDAQAPESAPPKAMGVIEVKPPKPRRPRGEPDLTSLERPALLGRSAMSASSLWQRLHPRARRRIVHAVRWVERSRQRIAWGFTLLAACAAAFVLFMMTLADSEPKWWDSGSMRTDVMVDLARRVENGAISHITADHQGATAEAVEWRVKLNDDGANAWLNLRLPVWLPRMTAERFEDVRNAEGRLVERQPVGGVSWPDSVEELRVAFVDGRFRIGARVRTGDATQIFGATLAPEVRDDGSLWMKATSISLGRLSLPASLVFGSDGGTVRDRLPPALVDSAEGEAIFSKLAGETPMFEDAVIRLGDGRRVRLLSLEVASDSLVARFRTE